MQTHVQKALDSWYGAWELHQETAQEAFTAAFPALTPATRCQCFGPTLRWTTPGEGGGKVCLDDHGRATIEFENVPKTAVGTAMTECWGADWFNEGAGGFAEAEPGQYHYEDEQTYAEYEFDVNADGTVTFGISYVKVDDIVTMLDALERALAEHRTARLG
ncbi:hypothetical protein [Streptomyces stelliscabiei]|uniref:hypothetical protein n=1 Tax=Streptomyces stelliscabiei TaxID=146820 RepID=UPI0029AD194C|nr:hypothetical protein [Streptomyces stelliscabiei]MDX2554732.1 hypothetical protein [Streptomyces stelliscabiei]MDX2613259.1 hypothetical protein [Streptomyces stelliscabiei]MDX2638465.1 hypothetical protein [Streptomyces stelliscabiei]MDX2661617.1 hypothetical protein [Streptomyces stelliscabiei]MDX2712250.1 hypothetical protein [Streptomyces stelliscabiei]